MTEIGMNATIDENKNSIPRNFRNAKYNVTPPPSFRGERLDLLHLAHERLHFGVDLRHIHLLALWDEGDSSGAVHCERSRA